MSLVSEGPQFESRLANIRRKLDNYHSEANFSLFDLLRVLALLGQPGGLLASPSGLGLEPGLDFGHAEVDEKGWKVGRLSLSSQPHGLGEVGHSLQVEKITFPFND